MLTNDIGIEMVHSIRRAPWRVVLRNGSLMFRFLTEREADLTCIRLNRQAQELEITERYHVTRS